ncbi:bifunctional DNA primase/polymerase [Rhodomicrobium lacus]|uniref:bifunctional DNA primase/polymerase n=1 Tax=Rhodomicrobium lacus TaxID=2498452 RepID=UPI000F8E7050|nr:bifunctional DNA primase/polymerase [Rhodomicrobium lacus]
MHASEAAPIAAESAYPTFAQHAPDLRRLGWAVLPAKGKSPLKGGFPTMRAAPGASTVDAWARETPDADIVFVAGLCSTRRGRKSIVVVDADDEDACGQAVEIFGETPGVAKTRRGRHFFYDGHGVDLGAVSSLRAQRFNIDMKHGRSGAAIVAAAPSPHEKQRDFRYAWEGCDASVLGELPPFPVDRLNRLLERTQDDQRKTRRSAFRQGSRGLGLNDYLVKNAWAFDPDRPLDNALELARQFNDDLIERGMEPLDEAELVTRTQAVVRDFEAGKIERRHGRRASCTSDAAEIRYFATLDHGVDALALLLLLRSEHGARCAQGETFRLLIKSMVDARVMGSWAARKYREARDLLLAEEFIREVKLATKGAPAEYSLAERSFVPSLKRSN